MPRAFWTWFAVLVISSANDANTCPSEEPIPQTADSTERDYADELPRIAPLTPEESLRSLKVAEGFAIELVASEPDVVDPVAISFDEYGRMFVTEMRGYSEDKEKNLGRIRVLLDSNNDGKIDESHVFADGLRWPTAVFCAKGGVLVADAPHVYWMVDRDGDLVADHRELVFTGFGESNVQGLLNSFQWSLDNRIVGATSSSGGSVSATRHPDATPVSLRGRDFAIDPNTMTLSPRTGGGQHGLTFTTIGDRLVCSNSDHIQQIVFEDEVIASNPFYALTSTRVSIAADGPQADVFRISPVEPWRVLRTRLRTKGVVPGIVEGGGRAAGYFTSATGIMAYRGDQWPAQWQDTVFIADVGGNLIHRKRLRQTQPIFQAERIDEKSEFVASSDVWFRPVQLANGPDGCLYILDMYREVIEHPDSLPPVIKRHIDLTSGRDRGRIYRVKSTALPLRRPAPLGRKSSSELVRDLDHPNGWTRETAARLLYERQDKIALPLLVELANRATTDVGRVHALYALHGMNALTEDVLRTSLRDRSPMVRMHAVQLTPQSMIKALEDSILERVHDPSIRVRFEVALALGRLDGARRDEAWMELAMREGADPAFRSALLLAVNPTASGVMEKLSARVAQNGDEHSMAFFTQVAGQVAKAQGAEGDRLIAATIERISAAQPERAIQVLISLRSLDGAAAKRLFQGLSEPTKLLIESYVVSMLPTAADKTQPVESRRLAIRASTLLAPEKSMTMVSQTISSDEPSEVQLAGVMALFEMGTPDALDRLMESLPGLGPAARSFVIGQAVENVAPAKRLISMIEQERLRAADLPRSAIARLEQIADSEFQARLQQLFGAVTKNRADLIERYRSALRERGVAERGRELFRKHCSSCHRYEGHGAEIGPNLAAMRARGQEATLVAVLDPNREVNPQFLSYSATKSSGIVVTGLIAEESAASLTVLKVNGQRETILRSDLEDLVSSGRSLMPEGLEQQITPSQFADLLEYLWAAP